MKGAHRQAHERAGGRWGIYWYAWRGGPSIGAYVAATRAEAEAMEEADAANIAREWSNAKDTRPAIGQFGRVIVDYQQSGDWQQLKLSTRKLKGAFIDRMREKFGKSSVSEITMDAVSEWLREIEAKHGKRGRDHAKSALSSVAAWGRAPERSKEARLPATFEPTKDFKNAYKAPPQDAWTALELEKLPEVRQGVRRILLLALNTGLRRGDLCRVAWTNVDWEAGVIRLVTSKGERAGRRIVIPLTRPLRAVLQEIGPQSHGPILMHSKGKAWTVDGMGHAVSFELKRLGIQGRLHGLRRSAATHLAKQGQSSRTIARVLGWSEADAEAMAAIYVSEGV
ncbi:MAG: tyrosine-type recombinase/integrase [Terricaulis sp.]